MKYLITVFGTKYDPILFGSTRENLDMAFDALSPVLNVHKRVDLSVCIMEMMITSVDSLKNMKHAYIINTNSVSKNSAANVMVLNEILKEL